MADWVRSRENSDNSDDSRERCDGCAFSCEVRASSSTAAWIRCKCWFSYSGSVTWGMGGAIMAFYLMYHIKMATLLFAPQPLAYARGSVRRRPGFRAGRVGERVTAAGLRLPRRVGPGSFTPSRSQNRA